MTAKANTANMLSLSLDPLLGRRESPHNSAVKGFFDVFESLRGDPRSATWERLEAPALWGGSVGQAETWFATFAKTMSDLGVPVEQPK